MTFYGIGSELPGKKSLSLDLSHPNFASVIGATAFDGTTTSVIFASTDAGFVFTQTN